MWWWFWRRRPKAAPPAREGVADDAADGRPQRPERHSGRGLTTQTRDVSRRWTACPAEFELDGRTTKAQMCNVSKAGAQFRLDAGSPGGEVTVGSSLTFTITTPYGTVKREGVVKWTQRKDEFYYFGVDFGALPADDPLAALADSPF